MKIGVIGASGLIGGYLLKFFHSIKDYEVMGTYNSHYKDGLVKFDFNESDFSLFNGLNFVIISGAVTKMDKCRLDSERSYFINVTKTIELIRYLSIRGIKPVFLSSDQVFDGEKGYYNEIDKVNPINNYGYYKVLVENYMIDNMNDFLILRLTKTYSQNISDSGIYKEIIFNLQIKNKIKLAIDQIFNPTKVEDLTKMIYLALKLNLSGIYHIASENIMSRYDFGLKICDELNFDKSLIEPCSIEEFAIVDKRTKNSSLDISKFKKKITLGF